MAQGSTLRFMGRIPPIEVVTGSVDTPVRNPLLQPPMFIKEAITVAKELAPQGAELLAETVPQLTGKTAAIAAVTRPTVSTAEALLPKVEIRGFSEYSPYVSNPTNRTAMDQLFRDPSRHEFLSTQWSAGPTKFVDQWRYGVAPLSAPLETNGIYSCVGLSVTDKQAGLHYLAHIDSDTAVADIVKSVSRFDLGQSSVRVLPGPVFFEEPTQGIHLASRNNVEKTIGALRQIPGGLKDFKFLHSTESEYYSIVSHEGRLYRGTPANL